MEMEMVRDWSALPKDLLAPIRRRLPTADFVRFAAVCKAWGREQLSIPAREQPWLIMPPFPVPFGTPEGVPCSCPPGGADAYRFFCPSDGKTYTVGLPRHLLHTAFLGSYQSWVVVFHLHTAEMFLFNPLTRASVTLPSLANVPDIFEALVNFRYFWREGPIDLRQREVFCEYHKVILSSEPNSTAVCKLSMNWDLPVTAVVGGERWTTLCDDPLVVSGERWATSDDLIFSFEDVIYHEGEAAFYGISTLRSETHRWEVDGEGAPFQVTRLYAGGELDDRSRHLAVHCHSGDLMLVLVDYKRFPKRATGSNEIYQIDAVKLFKYDSDFADDPWHPCQSVDGCSLFVGMKSPPICLLAEDVPGLRSNCIFLIKESRNGNMAQLWIYDLNEAVLECCLQQEQIDLHGHWFMPKLA